MTDLSDLRLSDLRLSDLRLSDLRPLLFWSERERGRPLLPIRSTPPVRLDGVGDAGRNGGVVHVVDTRLEGSGIVAVSYQVGKRGEVGGEVEGSLVGPDRKWQGSGGSIWNIGILLVDAEPLHTLLNASTGNFKDPSDLSNLCIRLGVHLLDISLEILDSDFEVFGLGLEILDVLL